MFLNHVKIALRSLYKFKGYTLINLLGLVLGLATGIMIILYVLDEASYDRFHVKADRIYRVETLLNSREGLETLETNAQPLGKVLERDFPEVEAVLYTRSASFLPVNHEGKRIGQRIHFATPAFFDIFSFELKKGNPQKALAEPYSIVITEAMEKKYFGGEDALHRTMTLSDTLTFVVTGVMADIPSNSHIQLDMLISFSTFEKLDRTFSYDDGWEKFDTRNYLLLKEGTDAGAFKAKASNIYNERVQQMLKDWGVSARVAFTPLKQLYLTAKSGNGMGPLGSLERLYLVSGIAAFVILLACINFINLTTARSMYRAREVGLRKVVGSTRSALIRQFLSESFMLTLLGTLVAIALIGWVLPMFNGLLQKNYTMASLSSFPVIAGIACLLVVVTFLSGYYPALVLSGFKPAEVLKGKMQGSSHGVRLRRALVIFQFTISAALVVGTLIVINQLEYMQKQELGFAKEEIVVVNAARVWGSNPVAFETFKNELKALSVVDNVTFTNSLPGRPGWQGQVAYPEGRSAEEAISVEYMAVDEDFIPTLGLQVIAGRGFDRQHEAELKEGLVLNETAVSMFGWSSPEEALNKVVTSPSGYPEGRVIGVVKDYHQFGLQQNIGPMVLDYNPQASYMFAVRFKASDTRHLIEQVNERWQKIFSGYDFHYFFLDQDFERQYQSEQRLANVFLVFTAIAIIIAMIGLLGLVSFMITSRTKEIGIRKVLGADVLHITTLLSKEFVFLVVAANGVAFPIVWYLAKQWLETFAYRVDLNPMVFIFTLVIGVLLTLMTISFQTVKAAMAKPVDTLRYE